MAEVICDTSPLQYLFQLGLLDLLPSLFGGVVVPEAVVAEIAEGLRSGVRLPVLGSLSWVRVKRPEHPSLVRLLADLGPGEREVLALGSESPGALVILDDGLARRYALHLGLRLVGTLGVLLRAKRHGLLAAVRPLIEELARLGFWVHPSTREGLLRLAGEAPSAP